MYLVCAILARFLGKTSHLIARRELKDDAEKKNNGTCCYAVLSIALHVMSWILGVMALVYLGAWFVLGFFLGVYLYVMTFLYQVRVSTTPGTSLFQFGLVFFPALLSVLEFFNQFGDKIGEQAVDTVANRAPAGSGSQTDRVSINLAYNENRMYQPTHKSPPSREYVQYNPAHVRVV